MAAAKKVIITCAVTGRCGDIVGVWIEPVTAQVTITFLAIILLPVSRYPSIARVRRP